MGGRLILRRCHVKFRVTTFCNVYPSLSSTDRGQARDTFRYVVRAALRFLVVPLRAAYGVFSRVRAHVLDALGRVHYESKISTWHVPCPPRPIPSPPHAPAFFSPMFSVVCTAPSCDPCFLLFPYLSCRVHLFPDALDLIHDKSEGILDFTRCGSKH